MAIKNSLPFRVTGCSWLLPCLATASRAIHVKKGPSEVSGGFKDDTWLIYTPVPQAQPWHPGVGVSTALWLPADAGVRAHERGLGPSHSHTAPSSQTAPLPAGRSWPQPCAARGFRCQHSSEAHRRGTPVPSGSLLGSVARDCCCLPL